MSITEATYNYPSPRALHPRNSARPKELPIDCRTARFRCVVETS